MGPHKIDRGKWDGTRSRAIRSSVRQGQGRLLRNLSRTDPQERLFVGAVIEIVARACRPDWARRSTQARCRSRRGHDEHQRGEGRRDRAGLPRPNCRARKMPTRCGPQQRHALFVQPRRRHFGRISTGQPVVARFAVSRPHPFSRHAAPSIATAPRPRSSPKAATTLVWASAPCRLRGHDGLVLADPGCGPRAGGAVVEVVDGRLATA